MLLSTSSSETHRRRGKNDAITAFLTSCVVAIVVLAGLTEWLIRDQVMPQDTREAHRRLLDGADASNAAFGDSHAARGFNALDGFVNLAYPSESIQDMSAKVAFYFSERAPSRVILQADPHLFAPYRVNSGRQNAIAKTPFEIFSSRHRSRALAYWEAFLRGGGRLESKVAMTDTGSLLSEGDLSTVPARKRKLEAEIRRVWHHIAESKNVVQARKEYAAMLDWLTARGARICLVSYPVSEDYALSMQTAGHETQIAFFANQAARVGARFVDARETIRDRHLFRDIDHLNRLGAMEFSPQLLEACFPKFS